MISSTNASESVDREQQPETQTLPARGDQFEAWLRKQRNISTSWSAWRELDYLLDQYRLHADTGTPLAQPVAWPAADEGQHG